MFGCSSARLARGWQRDSRNTRLRSGLPGGRGRANAADRLQVSVRSQLSLPCVCVSFMRDKTQSSNVSRIVWDCQTSERTAFGWRGRLDEGMHSAHKPRTCVHHKQATLLTACDAGPPELFPGLCRIYIAVMHLTIARPHGGQCGCVGSKAGVHLVWSCRLDLCREDACLRAATPHHMLCAVRHVSFNLKVRGQTTRM
jgi:hypothetical protein